jgi:pyridoxal 5'-phosphate synthase pdxT subunit
MHMKKKPIIGVLALQGAVEPHKAHIEGAGGEFRAVKTAAQFDAVDAFILPGGESTTMLKLIENFGLWESLAENFARKPVWGICAGAILIAQDVTHPAQKSFGLLPMTVQRNGYGRQLDSHYDNVNGYPVSFIRAPVITKVDSSVEILAEQNGVAVWVRKGTVMASAFHPELTLQFPSPMHQMFIEMA